MKRGKKTLGLLLGLIMILSLFSACNSDTPNSTDSTTKPTEKPTTEVVSELETDIMGPYTPYPETITITTGKILRTDPKFPEGQDSRNNIMLDLIKETLNVEYEILWEVDQSEYNNRLGLSIAAGAMPDMMTIRGDNYLTFRQLVDNGALADLTEAYEKCAGDYMKKIIDSFAGDKFNPIRFDDKIYAYPNMQLGYSQNLLWIRNDWLAELGLDAPKSVDDVINVARAFVEQNPGGNSAGETVGMILNSTLPLGGYSNYLGAEPIAHALGAYPRTWMKDADGSVYYGSIAPEMKEALGVLAEMYKEGLIDKSFVTRSTSSEAEALLKDNKCGMFFSAWWAGWPLYDMTQTYPEADWLALNAPLDSDGNFKHTAAATTDTLLVVSKDFEYPEAVIKTLNVEFESYRGLNEETKSIGASMIETGTLFQAAFPTGDINLEYYDALPKLGHQIKNYVETGEIEWSPDDSDYNRTTAEDAKRYAEELDVTDQNGWIAWYTRVVASTVLDAPENIELAPAFSYTTESMAELKPALESLEDAMILQIITGDKDLDYFDEFVEQWKSIGGDKLTEEVQTLVN